MTKLDFQPIPKRFMVWDGEHFLKLQTSCPEIVFQTEKMKKELVYELDDIISLSRVADISSFDIIQSINLFDKDGKEIFEGSIVENHFINKFGLVYYDEDVAGWRILYEDGTWDDLYYVRADIAVAGHILSNPELLERA